ncbi:hypothetical protein [Flavihumibacter profundi]|jgi:hypothetical protein|uniref:hypothetical protein n=1 Tax=Flavihumibacter profundi TaxID=2716883 RepID=UPI001CC5723A|nr:hypothetical protein [Flavihumibacter profundi]MBZ5859199.1 hypothetical protein [Flavihumibacter profundi]
MFKKDNTRVGLLLGLLGPIVGLFLYYFAAFYTRNVGFTEFLGYMKQYKSLLTGVSSISLIANAILFTVFINGRKDRIAKGIFIATLLYGITVLLIKVIA